MAIVALQTGDSWGDGLFGALKQRYEASGGKVQEQIRYDPATTEFSSEIAEAASAIKTAESTYGKDHVALELIAMADQAPALLLAAKSYPELLDIPWFGSDGYCMTTPIIQQSGDLAVKTKQVSTWFSFARTSRFDQLASKFYNKTGYAVQGFVVALYDSAWVLTYSLLMTQKYDGEALTEVLPTVADSYFGATGWTVLNEYGDRAAGDYDIYTINVVNGKTQWSIIGHYSGTTDSVTWLASS
jgi:branched-chain amino acid transport system substrate-binding protein